MMPAAGMPVADTSRAAHVGSSSASRLRIPMPRRTSLGSSPSGELTFSGRRKGNEYFLKHLLGTDSSLRATEAPPAAAAEGRGLAREAPNGKLDLCCRLDFRHDQHHDVLRRRAAGGDLVQKHDLNTTDMHPFVNSFNPAISPPWQTRTDFERGDHRGERSASSRPRTSGFARMWSPYR